MRKTDTSLAGGGLDADGDKRGVARGDTRTAQGQDQHGVPRMPHERDESADSQPQANPSHERVGRAGQSDAQRGVPDTSKGAELDATYDRLRDGDKAFRP